MVAVPVTHVSADAHVGSVKVDVVARLEAAADVEGPVVKGWVLTRVLRRTTTLWSCSHFLAASPAPRGARGRSLAEGIGWEGTRGGGSGE